MRRFELVRGLTRRFWHVSVEGQHVTVTTGVAGTPAQPLTATFPTAQAALAEQDRLVKERLSWGYVELELTAPLTPGEEAESPPLTPEPSAPQVEVEPPPPATAPAPRPDQAERAARAAAARKATAGKPRRSGPSKKLMGLPSQALALSVKSSTNRRTRREAMFTLVAQLSPETPRWVAENLLDADAVIRAAAEEYFARAPAQLQAAAAAEPKLPAPVQARLKQLKSELAPPAREAAVAELPPGLNEGARAQEAGAFWSAAALARPQLQGGAAIPLDAMRALVELKRTAPDNRASFVRWRQTCSPSSLEDFAWSLTRAFLAAGAAPEDAWALRGLVAFGADRTCERLVQLAVEFNEDGARDRARTAVSALGELGTDAALTALHRLEVELGRGLLAGEARQALADAARRRGLDPDSLADRLVDSLGLSPNGTRALGPGPDAPRVVLDATLHLVLHDAAGKPLSRLPQAADDDPAAAAAEQQWSVLKATAPRVMGEQVRRLELAMASRRRWGRDDFLGGLAAHPLLRAAARGLVWAAGGQGLPMLFTLNAQGQPVDVNGATVGLPEASVWLPHPAQLDEKLKAAWVAALAAAGRPQPFRQLDRPVLQLTPDEAGARTLARYTGRTVSAARLANLVKRGWKLGPADGGSDAVRALRKPVGIGVAQLLINPGLPGRTLVGAPPQSLGQVTWDDAGTLGPIEASELLLDLASLDEAPAGGTR